ncbi:MAG: hypothetical protein IIB55_09445, partial [Planctomycetes bacterium]|nr:hypothetical protein [Planctomycetota bacterium]
DCVQALGTWPDGAGGVMVAGHTFGSLGGRNAGAYDAFLARFSVSDPCLRDPEWICDGDVDGDGQVNPVDSGLVQAAFGSADESDLCQYDVDCDGQINPVDSGIVQSLFRTCGAPRDSCP